MISRIAISNFRGIADTVEVEFEEDLTALVGPNGSGKTTVIDAIRAFFEKDTATGDFNNKDKPVKITIWFSDMRPKLRALAKCKNDGDCEITFITSLEKGKLKRRFEPAMTGTEWTDFLDQSVIVIGSMSELGSEMRDVKSSPLTKLLQYHRKRTGINQAAYDHYKKYMDALPKLDDLSEGVSNKLEDMESSLQINFAYSDAELKDMRGPKIDVKMKAGDDFVEFSSNAGGNQRLTSYALLRYLHDSSNNEALGYKPMLVIDEPELHQHPIRQDSLYSLFDTIKDSFQIIYATHSEKFLNVKDFSKIRFFQKSTSISNPHTVGNVYVRLIQSSKKIRDADDIQKALRFLNRMHSAEFRTTLFSKLVVLVEGYSDKAIFETVSKHMGVALSKKGVSVFQCNGKCEIGKWEAIYDEFNIPVYKIYDGDHKKEDCSDSKKGGRFVFKGRIDEEIIIGDAGLLKKYKQDIINELDESLRFDIKNSYMAPRLVDMIYEGGDKLVRIENIINLVLDHVADLGRSNSFIEPS